MNLVPELRKTLVLAAPITAGHVSQMLLGLTDTLMIGRVGVVPLAASAFAHMILHVIFIIGIGLMTSVSVLTAHAYGARDYGEAGEVLRRGLLVAVAYGLIIVMAVFALSPFLEYLGQPLEVVKAGRPYLYIVGCSMPGTMLFVCFKTFSEALDSPWPAFWVGFGGVLLNVFLNWVLIYGNLGAPAMGLTGAGWATLISRSITLIVFLYVLWKLPKFRQVWPIHWIARVPIKPLMAMLKLGIPVSIQLLVEVGCFAASTYLMGWIGTVALAAHQIALSCAATSFMFPLGISLAVSIRVGHAIGGDRRRDARGIGLGALGMGLAIMGTFAWVFITFNEFITGFFTSDLETLKLASGLLIIAAIFQLFDGTQVVAIGALRGSKDVALPTWIVFVAYWVIALPVGYVLAFPLGFGAYGVWVGLATGLGLAALGLMSRFMWVTRRKPPFLTSRR